MRLIQFETGNARHVGALMDGETAYKVRSVESTRELALLAVENQQTLEKQIGVQPEWFFKGDGFIMVRPGAPFQVPAFAEDGGEEPEIAGLYVIAPDGAPCRVGYALGNEFSDHVMERRNYLYL